MKWPFFIAGRYFFSRKNPNSVNFITAISVFGYAIGSFALIVFLSALNGFERLIFEVYEKAYPDIKIESTSAKVFKPHSALLKKIKSEKEIKEISLCLEENAVVESKYHQVVATVKGVSENYSKVLPLDQLLVSKDKDIPQTLAFGAYGAQGLIYKLNLVSQSTVNIMVPSREDFAISNIQLNEDQISINGMLRVDEHLNERLLLVPYTFANNLFDRDSSVTSLELSVLNKNNLQKTAETLQSKLGSAFLVRDRIRQNDAVYKMFSSEKLITFGIMAFILMLITFNLTGSLAMLSIEKKSDRTVLKALGATPLHLRNIFLSEGALISGFGTLLGLFTGTALVWLQSKYGWVGLQSQLATAYPVDFRISDVILVLILCLGLGISGSLWPAWNSARTN